MTNKELKGFGEKIIADLEEIQYQEPDLVMRQRLIDIRECVVKMVASIDNMDEEVIEE